MKGLELWRLLSLLDAVCQIEAVGWAVWVIPGVLYRIWLTEQLLNHAVSPAPQLDAGVRELFWTVRLLEWFVVLVSAVFVVMVSHDFRGASYSPHLLCLTYNIAYLSVFVLIIGAVLVTMGGMSAIRWRLADFLKKHDLSAYALAKYSGVKHPNTVYRIARPGHEPGRLDLHTLKAILDGLKELTGQPARLADVLVYESDEAAKFTAEQRQQVWSEVEKLAARMNLSVSEIELILSQEQPDNLQP